MSTPRHRRTTAAALVGVAAASLVAAAPAWAHTGTVAGGLGDGLLHPVLGPDHLLAALAVGAVAVLTASRRLAWLVPIGFVVGSVVGGAAGVAGVSFPGVHLAVAGSLVVLGLLVTGHTRVAASWLPGLALLLGTAHGVAHGGEVPGTVVPLAYLTGLVLATVAVHAFGAAGGVVLCGRPGVRAVVGAGVAAAGAGLVALA